MKKFSLFISLLMVASIILAACGGGTASTPTAAPAAPPTAASAAPAEQPTAMAEPTAAGGTSGQSGKLTLAGSAARVPRAGEPALRLEVYSGGGVGAAAMVR